MLVVHYYFTQTADAAESLFKMTPTPTQVTPAPETSSGSASGIIVVILMAMIVGLIPYAPRLLSSKVENQLSGIDYSLNGYSVSCEMRGTDARHCHVTFPRSLDLAPQSVELTAPEFPAAFSVSKLPILETVRVKTAYTGETMARDTARTALYRDVHQAIKLANEKASQGAYAAAENKATYLRRSGG